MGSQSTDPIMASEWTDCDWEEIRKDFNDKDIKNTDDTGIFYNLTTDSTFKFKGEKYLVVEILLKICWTLVMQI